MKIPREDNEKIDCLARMASIENFEEKILLHTKNTIKGMKILPLSSPIFLSSSFPSFLSLLSFLSFLLFSFLSSFLLFSSSLFPSLLSSSRSLGLCCVYE